MTPTIASTLLVWGAATSLTISLLAATMDLARVAERSARASRRVREAADVADLVAVGAVSSAGAASGAGGATGAGGGADAAARSLPAAQGSGGALTSADVDGALAPSPRLRGIATMTSLVGTALLLGAIVARGIDAGRWPTANMYEFTLVGTFAALVVLTVVERRWYVAFVHTVVTGIAVLAIAFAMLVLYVRAEAVQPALQSYWLILHVGVAITSVGVFTVGFATTVLQVMQESRAEGVSYLDHPWDRNDWLRRPFAGFAVTGPRWRWIEQVPSAARLEATSFRLHAVGFVLWTFTLIGGAIWAEHAWGRYWGWDPKEVGTFIVWVIYAAFLHARTMRGWSGRRAAALVVIGYAAVIANFTILNLFVTGKHAYTGL